MITKKMERVDSEVNKALSQIIQFELNDPRINNSSTFLTVLKSEVTKDMKYCKTFVSVYPIEKGKEVIDTLNASQPYIRKCLAKKVLIRNIPLITFVQDTGADYSEHIDKLIKGLNKEESGEKGEE